MLPVLAQMTICAPRSLALETARVMPRSLKEQVGLTPSYLSHNSKSPPMASDKIVRPHQRRVAFVERNDGRRCRSPADRRGRRE